MKINFTKKQFRTLLDMVYIADFTINGIRLPDEEIKEYRELAQYIYSFAKDMACENLVEFDREYKQYFETRELEDGPVGEFIEEYDSYVFWEELVSRLAKRDVEKSISKSRDIGNDEFLNLLWAKEEVYNDEFHKNGLDNLRVEDI